MSLKFNMKVGHKGDMFFTQKEGYILRIHYNRGKCEKDVARCNESTKWTLAQEAERLQEAKNDSTEQG